ncbi:hypothetical protein [Moritella sp. F3]|uniref:hypothetical protein n=1 Tax=Moritella sp. F3 TaxID=2718882 RepID=UPI0018E125B6|nr:hypothetical protein [Moritella sp. F3]GIC77106.1 hypothetical protein FMO001_18330 [Moritella sp. F1]GIC82225.1 hypothetical protein FMO003_25060 [Moritella sp. F3]
MQTNLIKSKLTINESIPFPVTYKQEHGESVCVVKQNDLEELVRYNTYLEKALKITQALSVAISIALLCSVAGLTYLLLKHTQTTILLPV